jgi:sulfur-oxidizing protein SoxY
MIPSDLPPSSPRQAQHGLSRRGCLLGGLATALGSLPQAALSQTDYSGGDPLGSMQWPQLRRKFIGSERMQFSDAVLVKGPPMADDAMNVPLMVDARHLIGAGQEIDRIVIIADRNPVQHVATFMPRRAQPLLALRFRLEQASPVRALVRTASRQWHVGQTWIQAAGGGCTVPGLSRRDGSWSRTLNQVQARVFPNLLDGAGARLRLQVMHPMDTGLVAGIPAFHIEELELRDSAQQPWLRIELHEPVSENPLLTFEFKQRPPNPLLLSGRDNNGNRIEQEIKS